MEALAAVEAFFRARPDGFAAVYVFGSVGRGEPHAGQRRRRRLCCSRGTAPATLEGSRGDIAEALERVIGRAVDSVVLNRAPADLVHRVLRDGRLVLETDRAARVAFEVRLRREFFDLQPILEEYRRPRKTVGA